MLPLEKPPPEPEPSDDRGPAKETHDESEDACDICGATGVRLTPETIEDDEGGRFEMLVCPKCRQRRRP